MKINFGQILSAVALGAQVAEQLQSGKSGKEKQDTAIRIAEMSLPVLGSVLTTSEMNNQNVQSAIRQYIDATVKLRNVIKSETGKDVSFI